MFGWFSREHYISSFVGFTLRSSQMPRSFDPSRTALLKKSLAPRCSISVDDIQSMVSLQGSTNASLPWPVPQFFLEVPTLAKGSSSSSLRPPSPSPQLGTPNGVAETDLGHRGELDMSEKYNYDLSKAQLKASSRTSALLAGFAMVALVELQYDQSTPHWLLILLGVVTTLLVSVHLLALMMSTCILPYMEATGCTQDSPHIRLKFYIDLSWLFSTCIGLLLFLVEIGIIFFVKFTSVDYQLAGYITTAMLIPVVVVFVVFSYLIHKSRVSYTLGRFKDKVDTMKQFLDVEAQMTKTSLGAVKDI
ncbi:Calcium release-activated calcium channel protein 1 domain protein [Ancylostoma duodenale]|uniref:Protein orai n=1 Tax=Ancylostoma duodenale TaxID=51022 RepID=A0A0C2GCI4_9BILA|nr:Calcium release-activated calcium channel protein 1 domain protein [Ancylostoma duodenale]